MIKNKEQKVIDALNNIKSAILGDIPTGGGSGEVLFGDAYVLELEDNEILVYKTLEETISSLWELDPDATIKEAEVLPVFKKSKEQLYGKIVVVNALTISRNPEGGDTVIYPSGLVKFEEDIPIEEHLVSSLPVPELPDFLKPYADYYIFTIDL